MHINNRKSFITNVFMIALLAIMIVPGVIYANESVANGLADIFVVPELTTMIDMSNTDINRLFCYSGPPEVIYSKEKGVKVRYKGKNAFVKFMIKSEHGKLTYSDTPTELHIICGKDVYSIIAVPKKIPSKRTIRLSTGQKEKVARNRAAMKEIPFEKKIMNLIRYSYTDEIPDSFTVRKVGSYEHVFKDISINLVRVVDVDGIGLSLREYKMMINNNDIKELQLKESDFMKYELFCPVALSECNDNPKSVKSKIKPAAISLDKHNLKKGEIARLFVVVLTKEINNE